MWKYVHFQTRNGGVLIERFKTTEQINAWMNQVAEVGMNYLMIDGEPFQFLKE